MTYVQIIVTGMFVGSVYAISGAGIVLTYKATGVFNLAHFTVALFSAYVLWQLNGRWGVSLWISAPFVLLVVGPGIGVLLSFVFRPLQRRRASTSEKLVANLGLVVLFLGAISIIWGTGVQGNRREPVPKLWPPHRFELGGVTFDSQQLAPFIAVLVVGAGLYALLRFTFLGTKIQAVVDRRELAELATIDADRVSMIAWAIGCGLAALTGVLFFNPVLEPFRIIFFGIEILSVAVVARLVSLPVAIFAGIFLLGAGHDLLASFAPLGDAGFGPDMYQSLMDNFSVVVLFIALLAFRTLDELGESAPTGQGLVATELGRRGGVSRSGVFVVGALVAVAIALPGLLSEINMHYAQQMVALLVIFASIVCITGFSGHITLGQASIAGLGAFFTARVTNGVDLPIGTLRLPVVGAMLIGGAAALVAGLIAGYPALRRKGLFLGLTTLSLGLLIDSLVFNTTLFAGGPSGLVVKRPALFGFHFDTTARYYYFELVVAAVALLLANNLRAGRLGRILGAMRDSETAAKAIGVDLRRYKLFIFAASSFIAGLGGALLTMGDSAWDRNTFNPVYSLFWFVAVTVAGISTLGGAALAAVIYVMLPLAINQDIQSAVFFLGVGALFLGRLPGGLVGLLRSVPARLTAAARAEYVRIRRASEPAPPPEPLHLSPFASTIVAERQATAVASVTDAEVVR